MGTLNFDTFEHIKTILMKIKLFTLLFAPALLASCGSKEEAKSDSKTTEQSKPEEEATPAGPVALSTDELRTQKKFDESAIAAIEDKSQVYKYSSGYNLEAIPAEVLALTQLQTIELNNWRGNTLPEALKNMPNLQVIYLSGANNIEMLPEFLGEMKSLKTIAINNALKLDLGQAFKVLSKNPNIEHVQITYSKVESEIPAEIGKMSNLKTLDISNNFIASFNDAFFSLTNLQELMISSAKENLYDYGMLFSKMKSLPKLSKMSVYYVGLIDFPDDLKEYPSMKSINWREEGKGWENTEAITKTKEKVKAKFPNIDFPLAPYESLFYDFY